MDLNEHALTEAQRTLKRLGITHLWRTPVQERQPLEAPAANNATSSNFSKNTTAPTAADTPIPALLRSLFHGKQSPVRTLWTYVGLKEDLEQHTMPERMVVFRKIQESVCLHLKWKENDICSWPLDVERQLFCKGVEHFKPQIIIIFEPCEEGVRPKEEADEITIRQTGCAVHILPNLDEMATGNKSLKNEAWKILQTLPK